MPVPCTIWPVAWMKLFWAICQLTKAAHDVFKAVVHDVLTETKKDRKMMWQWQHLSLLCLGQSGMKTFGKFVINLLDVYPALPGLKQVFNITAPHKFWHLHFERPSVVAAPQRASRWWRRCGQPPSKSCHTSCGTPTNHLRFVFVNMKGRKKRCGSLCHLNTGSTLQDWSR